MKKAVSLIEVVISIVIIGIVVSTIPTVLTGLNNNQDTILSQEAILLSKTRMSAIMERDWDANSYYEPDKRSYILPIPADPNAQLRDRNGTNALMSRRARLPVHVISASAGVDLNASTTIGKEAGEVADFNDVDDFNGDSIGVEASTIANGDALGDTGNLDYVYRSTTNIATAVGYVSVAESVADYNDQTISVDFNPTLVSAVPTHMKHIANTINFNNNRRVVLHAFVSNIGQSGPVWRDF